MNDVVSLKMKTGSVHTTVSTRWGKLTLFGKSSSFNKVRYGIGRAAYSLRVAHVPQQPWPRLPAHAAHPARCAIVSATLFLAGGA